MKLKFLYAMASVFLVSACGFTLRGATALSANLQPLYVESVDASSPMNRELQRTLNQNDVTLTTNVNDANYRLGLGPENSSERALSVNANARAGEYELEISVPFQLAKGGDIVLPPETLSLSKVYLADPENAVAKNEEAELIRTEMRRELAQQILRRLQAYATR